VTDQAALALRTAGPGLPSLAGASEPASGPSHSDLEACPAILEPEVLAGGMEVIALSAWNLGRPGLYMV